ncbi:hypothetical protein Leryth_025601 [Lithospermum erythrorhizon]|nr:hypothetical protein Leryth_025601 [Lithospermum erythrorhizon]
MAMGLPNIGELSAAGGEDGVESEGATSVSIEDPSKKIRKPYTITKSRQSWTDPEHDKFLEALQLFDRDWKKIEAFIGSKTVIQYTHATVAVLRFDLYGIAALGFVQDCVFCPAYECRDIRSHAQKYFLKVQKSGTNEHLPPPRPKRKAAHPYPQKASKAAPVLDQGASFQTAPTLSEPDASATSRHAVSVASVPCRSDNSVETANLLHVKEGNKRSSEQQMVANLSCHGNEIMQKTLPVGQMTQLNSIPSLRVLPDFAQVYSFIGSIFDPIASGHLQKLKKMDRIDVETVLLLMRNLSINLSSPDFEEHRRLLSSYEIDMDKVHVVDDVIHDGLSGNAS